MSIVRPSNVAERSAAGGTSSRPQNARPQSSLSIAAAISTLLLVGIFFGASLWVLAGVTIALLMGVNYLLANTWSDSAIAIRATGDRELKVGSKANARIEITNTAKVPLLWLLVEDLLPRQTVSTGSHTPPLEIDGERLAVMMLWPGQTKEVEYQINCHRRGYLQIGPTVLETGDLMGLFRRFRVGTDPQYITVMPEIIPLTQYEIGSRRPIGEIRMRANVMDDPTRLRGIRQWQIGDPMRSVHWAATARTGTLHSKIYEPSSIAGATLILDLHNRTNPNSHEPVRTDLAVTAATSIAASLHESGEPFGLVTNGRDAADRIRTEGWQGDERISHPRKRSDLSNAAAMRSENDRLNPVVIAPSRGPAQLKEIHRTLARLERTDGLTLAELFVECESQLAGDTTLLVILQQATAATIATLVGLSKRGRAVAVIINTHDINDYTSIAGPLIASRIPTFYLSDKDSIADVCRSVLVRA